MWRFIARPTILHIWQYIFLLYHLRFMVSWLSSGSLFLCLITVASKIFWREQNAKIRDVLTVFYTSMTYTNANVAQCWKLMVRFHHDFVMLLCLFLFVMQICSIRAEKVNRGKTQSFVSQRRGSWKTSGEVYKEKQNMNITDNMKNRKEISHRNKKN